MIVSGRMIGLRTDGGRGGIGEGRDADGLGEKEEGPSSRLESLRQGHTHTDISTTVSSVASYVAALLVLS